jgi:pimeloyl-ACP methyl ester carboxylesterase
MSRPMPDLAGVSHEFHEVNGTRLHVACAGDSGSEPLLMLHGWPQHWWTWRKLIGPLSERYRVLCPDLRGFGWSQAPRGHYLKVDLADDVIALADALGLGRFRLAGHDWGGFAGFHVCRKRPDRVSHYAAAGISHLWPRSDLTARQRLDLVRRLWYQFVIASPLLGRQVVQRVPALTRTVFAKAAARPGAFTPADVDSFTAQWAERDRARAAVAVYRSFLTRELPELARGAYRDEVVATPTVILVGAKDPVITVDALTGAGGNLPNLELRELAGVGHFVPEEAPEEMLAAMRALFER